MTLFKTALLLPILGLAVLNGLFSPRLFSTFALQYLWYPPFLPQGFQLLIGISGLVLTILYLMVSGIPAALFEKLFGNRQPSVASRLIWLVTLAALTVPNIPAIRAWLNLLL